MGSSQHYDFAYDNIRVIESLPASDRKTGQALFSEVIAPHATRVGLGAHIVSVETSGDFLAALDEIGSFCESGRHSSIVHFEMHGTQDGLTTADGCLVPWSDLKSPLTRINAASRLNLLVTVAACSGEYMLRCMTPSDRAPVCHLVGCNVPIWESVADAGFKRFYDVFLTTNNLLEAWRSLNVIGKPDHQVFGLWPAKYFFRHMFAEYCHRMLSPSALQARTQDLHKNLVSQGVVRIRDGPAVRERLKAALLNRAFWLDRFKLTFFMLDLYPENAGRFDITLEEVLATNVRQYP